MTRIEYKEQINILIRKYERQLTRCQEKEVDLENKKDNLSNHGYWSLGYFGGKTSLYEDVIDDLKELISLATDQTENNILDTYTRNK